MWLKGSRHKCRGSGGLEREHKDQRGSAVSPAAPHILPCSPGLGQPHGFLGC